MIYLYAITESGAQEPLSAGLEDAELQSIDADGLGAIYSSHERHEIRPEPDALWRHDHVVEAAMEAGSTLPIRFGTTFPDTAGLRVALHEASSRLHEALDLVRGCVELAVRIGVPVADNAAPRGGREYVEAKLADRREHEAAAELTLVPLSELAVSVRTGADLSGSDTITASYLVRAGDVDNFANEVRRIQRRHSSLSLSCTGPWPPYSFADGAERT